MNCPQHLFGAADDISSLCFVGLIRDNVKPEGERLSAVCAVMIGEEEREVVCEERKGKKEGGG